MPASYPLNVQDFESQIRMLLEPLNGQYPRPWMTTLKDPLSARVFIVGKNQAKGFPTTRVGSLDRMCNSLFNRNGMTCRGLYDEISGYRPSPTRQNTDTLTATLRDAGITEVLETNVICYSSPMSADLRLAEHAGGKVRGSEIFLFLLRSIQPQVLIVHGAGARDTLSKFLGSELAPIPESPAAVMSSEVEYNGKAVLVIVSPSLAPPKYNQHSSWVWQYLDKASRVAARKLGR